MTPLVDAIVVAVLGGWLGWNARAYKPVPPDEPVEDEDEDDRDTDIDCATEAQVSDAASTIAARYLVVLTQIAISDPDVSAQELRKMAEDATDDFTNEVRKGAIKVFNEEVM